METCTHIKSEYKILCAKRNDTIKPCVEGALILYFLTVVVILYPYCNKIPPRIVPLKVLNF